MVIWLIVGVFVAGYAAIALEHSIGLNKAGSALATGVVCWTIYALSVNGQLPGPALLTNEQVPEWFQIKIALEDRGQSHESLQYGSVEHASTLPPAQPAANLHQTHSEDFIRFLESIQKSDQDIGNPPSEASVVEHGNLASEYLLEEQLLHALGEISGVLFFILGAMMIVELVDAFEGFKVITDRIQATSKVKLLWIFSMLTFFMSAVLDNLASTIVMISLSRKLISDSETRWFYAGMIVCAANAGGVWSVIGDVTTTMLWIAGKLSPMTVITHLFLPSLVCLLVPLIVLSFKLTGIVERPINTHGSEHKNLKSWQIHLMFWLGLFCLLAVPVFKTITHLPPYMGMLLSLSLIWFVAEVMRRDFDDTTKSSTHVLEILQRIDTSSILFFLGILLAVECLASVGMLERLARGLDATVGNQSVIALLIGFLSSAVDNVPLVAGGIRMYDFPKDHRFWQILAYCAGTGGSCLIIGSAAGVAAMSLERIDFVWYLRKISLWAVLGYLSGAATYLAMESLWTL